jgi:hypothetical protein
MNIFIPISKVLEEFEILMAFDLNLIVMFAVLKKSKTQAGLSRATLEISSRISYRFPLGILSRGMSLSRVANQILEVCSNGSNFTVDASDVSELILSRLPINLMHSAYKTDVGKTFKFRTRFIGCFLWFCEY